MSLRRNLQIASAQFKSSVALLCLVLLTTSTVGAVSDSTTTGVMDSPSADSVARHGSKDGPDELFKGGIKYLGGPGFPDFKGRETWANSLLISGDQATCSFANKKLDPVAFSLGDVTSIMYGQASSRRAGTWVSIGVILAPVALLGLLHKSRKHNVLVSWKEDGGQERGVYLEAQSHQIRRLLNTLSYRSEKPILADSQDRKWLLTQGVAAEIDPSAAADAK